MTPEQREMLSRRMERIGSSVGINFKWGGKVGRTYDAHKLVYTSRSMSTDAQSELVEKLFRAYHENEQDISCKDHLRKIAASVGLSEDQVNECFESSTIEEALKEEAALYRAQTEGSGVPTFLIQGKYKLSGAQDVQDFMDLFVQVKENPV